MTSQPQQPEPLLTTTEAAAVLRVAPAFLRRDRRRADPRVPAIELGPRTYRYEGEALRRLARTLPKTQGDTQRPQPEEGQR